MLEARPNLLLRITGQDLLVMTSFFALIYIEPISLGLLKISEIWKSLFILGVVALYASRHFPPWFLFALLYALKCLVYTTFPYGVIGNAGVLMEFLFLPTLLLYFYATAAKNDFWQDRLIIVTIKIALFFVLTTIPFLFGLSSLYPDYDLSRWGRDGSAVTSFFSSLAPASKVYYTSALILLASRPWFPKNLYYQLLYWSAVILGAYLVYASFTRTGWIIYAAGAMLVFTYGKKLPSKIVALWGFGLVAIGLAVVLMQDSAFMLRLAGGAVGYRENVEFSVDGLLRSRIPFVFTAIDNLNQSGPLAWLIGHGYQEGLDQFALKTGMAIRSHNGLFNILETTGLLGLLLYVTFCAILGRALIRALWQDTTAAGKLYFLVAFLWISTFLTSHELPIYAQVVLAGPIARALLLQRYGFGRSGPRRSLVPRYAALSGQAVSVSLR